MNSTDHCRTPIATLNKQVSDSASSLSRPSTPSPAPMWPSSSTSSTSNDNSSIKCAKSTKVKKSDIKWICPRCQEDVRIPPLCASAETNECIRVGGEEFSSLKKFESKVEHQALHVKCALKSCPSPRYHLSCSGVPKGSQIFSHAIMSCQAAANEAAASSNDSTGKGNLKHVEQLYSSTGGVWWDPPPGTNIPIEGNQCTPKSLENSKNWPTSMQSFLCPNCDVEGKSRYLLEYFERFQSMKKSFYADYLTGTDNGGAGCRRDRADESVEARTGRAFLSHLLNGNKNQFLNNQQDEGGSICDDGGEQSWNPSEIQLHNMAKTLTFLSKQQQMQQHRRRQKRQKNKFQLDPSYLVGMPIRLFNPVDSSYHSGRVLDFRTDAPHQVDQSCASSLQSTSPDTSPAPDFDDLIDGKICSTLFLIRFRQGVEGRKVAVHEWIYLEEHAVAIGGEICWAKVGHHSGSNANVVGAKSTHDEDYDVTAKSAGSGAHVLKSEVKLHAQKGDFVSQYRPVQIIFRSMLEMVPVQNLNCMESCLENKSNVATSEERNPCLKVLAMGFGEAFSHVRLYLGDSGIRTAKEMQLEGPQAKGSQKEVATAASTVTAEQMMPEAIPLTPNNPSWIDRILHRAQLSDEDVALGLAMACAEKEEERRIRSWRQLPVSHLYQPCLTKRNHEEASIAKQSMSIKKSKKQRMQCSVSSIKSSLPSIKTTMPQDDSLENAASFGCSKCKNELQTGIKTKRSHDPKCPRKRENCPFSLEVAAGYGCKKCMNEMKTGKKTKRSHDLNCPRSTNYRDVELNKVCGPTSLDIRSVEKK